MIEPIKHKALRRLFENNDYSSIRSDQVEKVRKILSALEAASGLGDLALPMFRLHSLTGGRRGTYWRVTFRFHEGAAYDIDLEDYH